MPIVPASQVTVDPFLVERLEVGRRVARDTVLFICLSGLGVPGIQKPRPEGVNLVAPKNHQGCYPDGAELYCSERLRGDKARERTAG